MNKVPRGLYTPEFRQEAVKLVEASGLSIEVGCKHWSRRGQATNFSA